MISTKNSKEETEGEKPPFLSSWNRIYVLVFLNLILLIILFYLFAKIFS
jgi:hypothetical protein